MIEYFFAGDWHIFNFGVFSDKVKRFLWTDSRNVAVEIRPTHDTQICELIGCQIQVDKYVVEIRTRKHTVLHIVYNYGTSSCEDV